MMIIKTIECKCEETKFIYVDSYFTRMFINVKDVVINLTTSFVPNTLKTFHVCCICVLVEVKLCLSSVCKERFKYIVFAFRLFLQECHVRVCTRGEGNWCIWLGQKVPIIHTVGTGNFRGHDIVADYRKFQFAGMIFSRIGT